MKVFRAYQQPDNAPEVLLVVIDGKKATLEGEEITVGEAIEFMAVQAHKGVRLTKWEE